ncbi:MAG: VCBS repeat-containing protein [Chloroflexota bacterium]
MSIDTHQQNDSQRWLTFPVNWVNPMFVVALSLLLLAIGMNLFSPMILSAQGSVYALDVDEYGGDIPHYLGEDNLTLPKQARTAQISFCSNNAVLPGDSFNHSGSQTGLAPGRYRMTIDQTGPFTIQNLQGFWNTNLLHGFYHSISGNTKISYSGVVPTSALPGQSVVVTFNIYDILGRLVARSYTAMFVTGSGRPGWEKVWEEKSPTGGGINRYERFYPGDFDGDGAEEILAVGSGLGNNVWMTMYYFENGDWQWGWSNFGDPLAGNGIYPYRNHLLVGDFDGDQKDEVLGIGNDNDWMTMFYFENGDWQWGWSNAGNSAAGNGIYPYRRHLLVGDYDGDQKDEVLPYFCPNRRGFYSEC